MKNTTYSKIAVVASLAIASLISNPAMAEASSKIRFSSLEFSVPQDPLLWSSTPNGAEQHTPAAAIAYAASQLRAAIPAGLSAAEARNRLQAAGSHCDTGNQSVITCRYTDAQIPDSEYLDYVVWKVRVPLVNGQVADLQVMRDWYRR